MSGLNNNHFGLLTTSQSPDELVSTAANAAKNRRKREKQKQKRQGQEPSASQDVDTADNELNSSSTSDRRRSKHSLAQLKSELLNDARSSEFDAVWDHWLRQVSRSNTPVNSVSLSISCWRRAQHVRRHGLDSAARGSRRHAFARIISDRAIREPSLASMHSMKAAPQPVAEHAVNHSGSQCVLTMPAASPSHSAVSSNPYSRHRASCGGSKTWYSYVGMYASLKADGNVCFASPRPDRP